MNPISYRSEKGRKRFAAKVKPGLEVFLEERIELARERRIGIIANQSSVNSRLEHIVDLFLRHPAVQVTALMGPQHGVWGETQDNMIEWEDHRDTRTGLPVYSLYGKSCRPSPEALSRVDTIVFDLQDVGSRYYTFLSTMTLAMEACTAADKAFIVLDRPNPLNGVSVEGTVLDARFRSFVGCYPLAIRHGMTVGELALYFNAEFDLGCRLEVVKMQGWKRDSFFDETGLQWIPPSPNLPTLDSALVYPGMCLLEGTHLSEGRGTTRPFELSGAPWVDPHQMVERLKEMDLPGVFFRPLFFVPTFHKWSGESVGGVQIHLLDRHRFKPFLTGLALVGVYRELAGDRFQWKEPPYEYECEKLPFDILCGTDRVRRLIEAEATLEELERSWENELEEFRKVRERYLLY